MTSENSLVRSAVAPEPPARLFPLIPLVTAGWGTVPTFVYVAVKTRATWAMAAAATYVPSTIALVAADFNTTWFKFGVLVNCLGGTIHAVLARSWLAKDREEAAAAAPAAGATAPVLDRLSARERALVEVDPVLRETLQRRERRRMAREIVATDPALARELRIGRPFEAGSVHERDRFDDGGLVDINAVAAATLTTLPGIDEDAAGRIVAVRDRLERLRSGADLIVHAGLAPDVVAELSDRLLFSEG